MSLTPLDKNCAKTDQDMIKGKMGKYELPKETQDNSTASAEAITNGQNSRSDHKNRRVAYHPEIIVKIKEPLHNGEGVAFVPDGKIFVADKHDDHVWQFSSSGTNPSLLAKGVKSTGIATNKNSLIAFLDVRDKKHALVKVYSVDGSLKSSFGQELEWHPHGIALSDNNYIVVTDMAAKSGEIVRIFSLEGELLSSFGEHGKDRGQLLEPYYVIVDCKNRVLVSDKANNSILGYSMKGEYLGRMGSHGSSPGHLNSPRGLTEDPFGNIIVCDAGNRRLSSFSHDGHFIQHLMTASEGVHYPIDVDCHRTYGKLVVTMHTAHGDFHKIKVYKIPLEAGSV